MFYICILYLCLVLGFLFYIFFVMRFDFKGSFLYWLGLGLVVWVGWDFGVLWGFEVMRFRGGGIVNIHVKIMRQYIKLVMYWGACSYRVSIFLKLYQNETLFFFKSHKTMILKTVHYLLKSNYQKLSILVLRYIAYIVGFKQVIFKGYIEQYFKRSMINNA